MEDNPSLYTESKAVYLKQRKGQNKVNCISWHFTENMSSFHGKSLKEQLAILAENYRLVKKYYTNTKDKSYMLRIISRAL